MPRRYYRRTRYYRYSKKKWSPTLGQGVLTTAAEPSSTGFGYTVLCSNSSLQGTQAPVTTIIKVKNFKCVIDIVSKSATTPNGMFLRNVFYAIMFVPQGFTITANTPIEHPEWIMVWRTSDFGPLAEGSASTASNLQLSSRLTRNLNSGDQIVLFNSFYNSESVANTVLNTFYCSFVTCNN